MVSYLEFGLYAIPIVFVVWFILGMPIDKETWRYIIQRKHCRTTEEIYLGYMKKTNENPLGINVMVCPICMEYSFFANTRSQTVKHFWHCYHKKILGEKLSNV